MNPVPRHPELDKRLAIEGASPEIVQVYGDWLIDRQHPLGEWIVDAIRAERGDSDAHQRTIERRFSITDPDRFPSTVLSWCAGMATKMEQISGRTRYASHAETFELFLEPVLHLLTDLRIECSSDDDDDDVFSSLILPPSLGRIAVEDARVPASTSGRPIDLSMIDLPNLRDLRLRLGALAAPPSGLERLTRLELCVPEPTAFARPLPALQTLHLWSGVGRKVTEALIGGAPALHTLGLHHAGTISSLLSGLTLPPSLRELIVAVPSANQADLRVLRAAAPHASTIRLPWAEIEGPLHPPFVSTPAADQPIYIF